MAAQATERESGARRAAESGRAAAPGAASAASADLNARATREKKLAALGSVASAVVLVTLKVFLAVVTGSLGVLSEALHSILDLVAAVITYLSVRVSDKPADAQHLYGHGKVESFSAFVETGLLLLRRCTSSGKRFSGCCFRNGEIRPSLAAS